MACFLLTNSHKIFDSFFFLGKKKKKRIQGEKKETHQERLPYFYVYLCKCSTEDIFRFFSTKPHRSAAAHLGDDNDDDARV